MARPLQINPNNPTRFLWNDRATFLLGSTEHYGALLNTALDYTAYLDTLQANRLNLTRAFTFYREIETSIGGEIGYANTLAPRPEMYLAPWSRTNGQSGVAPDGLPRFDLDVWDERYFSRLKGFLTAAAERGIVVELVLFCNPYSNELLEQFPLHPSSNVNGVGAGLRTPSDFMSLADPSIVDQQKKLIRKIVAETNAFDNLYYEVCNEPGYCTTSGGSNPIESWRWQHELAAAIRQSERTLPRRHLIAVNSHQTLPSRVQTSPDDQRTFTLDDGFYRFDSSIDILNVHYMSAREPRAGLQHVYSGGARNPIYRFGSIASFVALRQPLTTPISYDEDFTGMVHGEPPRPAQNRMEAWESFVGGCAAYDHLDFTFTPDDPTGSGQGYCPPGMARRWFDGRPLRAQLGYLAAYANSLDLTTFRSDPRTIQMMPVGVGGIAAHSDGDEYQVFSIYLADLRSFGRGFGSPVPPGVAYVGSSQPSKPYAVRSLNPRTGEWTDLRPTTTDIGGNVRLDVPEFREDLLIHLEGTP